MAIISSPTREDVICVLYHLNVSGIALLLHVHVRLQTK